MNFVIQISRLFQWLLVSVRKKSPCVQKAEVICSKKKAAIQTADVICLNKTVVVPTTGEVDTLQAHAHVYPVSKV